MKAAIILVTFLSISSITSLSDVVFEWKGFILDAIEFYRKWIVNPFRSVATLIGLNYVDIEVDAIVLFSTQMSVQFRSQVVPQKLNIAQLVVLLVTIVAMGLGNPGLDPIGIWLIATTLLALTLFAIVSYRTDRDDIYSRIWTGIGCNSHCAFARCGTRRAFEIGFLGTLSRSG